MRKASIHGGVVKVWQIASDYTQLFYSTTDRPGQTGGPCRFGPVQTGFEPSPMEP